MIIPNAAIPTYKIVFNANSRAMLASTVFSSRDTLPNLASNVSTTLFFSDSDNVSLKRAETRSSFEPPIVNCFGSTPALANKLVACACDVDCFNVISNVVPELKSTPKFKPKIASVRTPKIVIAKEKAKNFLRCPTKSNLSKLKFTDVSLLHAKIRWFLKQARTDK